MMIMRHPERERNISLIELGILQIQNWGFFASAQNDGEI